MIDRQVAHHIANLSHKDPDIRRHSANALGEIGDPVAVPALIGTLNDRTDFVRRKAAIALKRIGAPAVPALAKALKTGEDLVREAAFDALMEFGNASALPAVIEALKDHNIYVRGVAVKVLDKIGDGSAIPALVVLVRDRYDAMWRNRYAAAERERYRVALAPFPAFAYADLGSSPDRPLRPSKQQHDQVRSEAVEVLGKIGEVAAIPVLIEALSDEDASVRRCAAEALGRIGEVSVVPALIEAWHACDPQERRPSYGALWRIGDAVTLPRKILAEACFSAQERVDILERLRHVYYEESDLMGSKIVLHYQLSKTSVFCREVLTEEDADARRGALSVLNWLNGERHLLHASQEDSAKQCQELVRPAQGHDPTAEPKTLLRAEPTAQPTPTPATSPTLWRRLFGNNNGATS